MTRRCPTARYLHDDIAPLASLQALHLRHETFPGDVRRLIRYIDNLDDDEPIFVPRPPRRRSQQQQGRIDAILEDVAKLLALITRHNLYDFADWISDLADQIELEDRANDVEEFQQSAGCHHIRGLAALLRNQIDATEFHLAKSCELVSKDEQIVETMSLYYRGILKKNIRDYTEALEHFEAVAVILSIADHYEIRTPIEIAEIVALASNYQKKYPDIAFIHQSIDELLSTGKAGENSLSEFQVTNLQSLQERLYQIEGNYDYMNDRWDEAMQYYLSAAEISPDGVFTTFSLGLTHLQLGEEDEANREFVRTYNLIQKGFAHEESHHELRGRILRWGTAVIAAKLGKIDDPRVFVILVALDGEIRQLKTTKTDSGEFHIFSPLTKRLVTVEEFQDQIANPTDYV